MSEQKKLTTAEILAMARKGTSGGAAKSEPAAETPAAEPPAAAAPKEAKPVKPAADKPAKPAVAAGGARPSIADILAAARAGGATKADAAAAPEPAAEKPKPAPKPKPEAKPRPKADDAEAAPIGGPKDTASILAAARKGLKPGPMTKEAAAKQTSPEKQSEAPVPAAKASAKTKPTVPPMPAKPSAAKPKAAKGADEEDRRGFIGFMLGSFLGLGFTSLAATFSLWGLGTARFMFPNILTEPPSQFKVGFPADFPPGSVADKFKAQFGVWVVNYEFNGIQQIYALRTVCTHLGCTPNWLEGEQKFKCPCHGSGFYKDGINFEGPAPRPLERFAIRLADDGQLEIDKSKLFFQEKGEWTDVASYVPV